MLRQLTAEEYLRVQLATTGESFSHRLWPPDVVRAVAAAELVRAGECGRVAVGKKALGTRLRVRLWGRRRGAERLAAA